MRTSAIALAVTLAVAAPLTAQAKGRTVEFTKISGDTAVATWEYAEGDVATYVSVVASKSNGRENGQKTTDAFLVLAISRSEISTGNILLTGTGYTANFDFSVDG